MSVTGEVWTLAEVRGGRVHAVSRELLAWGRTLADDSKKPLASVVIGNGIENCAEELIAAGADKVYIANSKSFEQFKPDAMFLLLCKMIDEYMPSVLIASATTQGRTIMPMLQAELGCGLTADCTGLFIEPETLRLIQSRPAIGGNVMANIKTKGRDPQMCTVRPKSKRPLEPDLSRRGEVIRIEVTQDIKSIFNFVQFNPENSVGVPIQEAEYIVCGGKGMKNAKNWARLSEFARRTGATLGATRAAVDLGWAPYSAQIGLSGKSVTPRVYIAFGVSGAVQHIAGMSGAETIIAVNSDPEAPIFRVADLAIQADAVEVLNALMEELADSC